MSQTMCTFQIIGLGRDITAGTCNNVQISLKVVQNEEYCAKFCKTHVLHNLRWDLINPSNAEATFVQSIRMQKHLKVI